MHQRIVFINGKFVPENQANISIFDSALATGEVIVEVTRTFNQKLFCLQNHLHRLYSGLKEMNIDPGITILQMKKITQEVLKRNLETNYSNIDWQTIHYVSRGLAAVFEIFPQKLLKSTVIIQCVPLQYRQAKMATKYRNGIDLVIPPQKAIPAEIISPQIKSRGRLDYIIARIQAKSIKVDSMGVLLDANGFITEGTGASLFMVADGIIKTAPANKVLQGITRKLVFQIAKDLDIPIIEENLQLSEVKNAQEIFMTSTIICLVHARSFERIQVGNGKVGPITSRIRDGFINKVGLDYITQANEYERILQSLD